MDQFNFNWDTTLPPHQVKRRRSEPSNTSNQPRSLAYTERCPAHAYVLPHYNHTSLDFYDNEVVSSTPRTLGHRIKESPDRQPPPICMFRNPFNQETPHRSQPTTPIYMPSSPVRTCYGSDQIQNSPLPTTPPTHIAWQEQQSIFYTPVYVLERNTASSPFVESTYDDIWPQNPDGAPLIWSSEVDVEIIPACSSPYLPDAPYLNTLEDPFVSDSICPGPIFIPVPTYEFPEQDSLPPEYQMREVQCQNDGMDEEFDGLLFQMEADLEVRPLQLEIGVDIAGTDDHGSDRGDSPWRSRCLVDYGSDADDEGSLGGY